MKQLQTACFVGLALAWASPAWAYPQFIAKGYTNCVTCHYSPTGGGLPNSYGYASQQATFPDVVSWSALADLRDSLMKNDVLGVDDEGTPALQWDAGLDVRMLALSVARQAGGDPEWVLVPMLAELSGVVARGPWLVYASATPRRAGTQRVANTVMSREHWLRYALSDVASVRVGRLVLPFGLRLPDHTQYTREDLGFDKWAQSYAAEVDYYSERGALSAALFVGDLTTQPRRLQERGAMVSGAIHIPSRASLGAAVGVGQSGSVRRGAIALNARLRIWNHVYGLAEAALWWRRSRQIPSRQMQGVSGYGRLGWFVLESLDLHLEWGGRRVREAYEATRMRYGVGAAWQALPWVELLPSLLLEETVETGLQQTALLQIHIVY